jgi:hypothetical protein
MASRARLWDPFLREAFRTEGDGMECERAKWPQLNYPMLLAPLAGLAEGDGQQAQGPVDWPGGTLLS